MSAKTWDTSARCVLKFFRPKKINAEQLLNLSVNDLTDDN